MSTVQLAGSVRSVPEASATASPVVYVLPTPEPENMRYSLPSRRVTFGPSAMAAFHAYSGVTMRTGELVTWAGSFGSIVAM